MLLRRKSFILNNNVASFFLCGDIVNKFADEPFIDVRIIDIIKDAD